MLRLRSLARRGLSSLNAWDPATQTQRAGAVAAAGAALDVDFYQFSFVDLFGVQRSKLVPASRVVEMAEAGAGFGGFAAWLDQDPSMGLGRCRSLGARRGIRSRLARRRAPPINTLLRRFRPKFNEKKALLPRVEESASKGGHTAVSRRTRC